MGKTSGAMDALHKAMARIEAEKLEQRLAKAEALAKKSSSDQAEMDQKLAAIAEAQLRQRQVAHDDDIMSTKEVAAMLHVHVKTVASWIRKKSLPCKHRGRNLIFRRGDVRAWEQAQ